MSKISDKADKFLLNYSYLFGGPLFIGTQCSIEASSYHVAVIVRLVPVNGDGSLPVGLP